MDDRLVERLRQAVLDSPATTDPATRIAAAAGGALPEPVGSYARKVRDESYGVTDAEVERLTAAGHSEDEVFEITVAAALGPALRSLQAGLRAMEQQDQQEET